MTGSLEVKVKTRSMVALAMTSLPVVLEMMKSTEAMGMIHSSAAQETTPLMAEMVQISLSSRKFNCDGNDTIYGGAGGGWTDTIQLQDELGGSDLGVYGTDWTVALTEGTIEETNADNLLLSDDADGTITLEDGSSIDFTDIERIEW